MLGKIFVLWTNLFKILTDGQKAQREVLVSVSFISIPPVKKKTQTTTIDHTTPSRTRKRRKQQNAEHYIMQKKRPK